MTQQKITENTVFYRIYPEHAGAYGDYFHREIGIYTISKYALERINGSYFDLTNFLTLSYQKNGQNDEHASENMKTRFYGEHVDEFREGPNSDSFSKASKIFAKMEKVYHELESKGLTVQNSDDAFLFRVAMLKQIGAIKVDFSDAEHAFYSVDY